MLSTWRTLERERWTDRVLTVGDGNVNRGEGRGEELTCTLWGGTSQDGLR